MSLENSTELAMDRYMSSEVSIQVAKERSPLSTPPVYAPSYVISHGKNFQNQTFCIPSDGSYHVRSVPEMRGMRCEGSCYGWLILQNYISNECQLFNPVTLNKIQLPVLPHDTFDLAVLTYPPTDPKCVVMLFDVEENLCIFCRVGDEKWTEQRDGNIHVGGYYSAISRNGKIYLFFSHGIAVIDVQDNVASCIELHNIKDPRPNCSRLWRYILESDGEIFHVCRMHLGVTRIIQKFVVFKLDFSKMVWVEVDSLGDKIFLLSSSSNSIALSAAEVGAKGNCLYFFADERTDLYCFNMEDGTIAITRNCPTKFRRYGGPFWVVPIGKVQVKKQVIEVIQENQVNGNLLPELLEMIFQSVSLGGFIRFRGACRAFMSFTRPIRSVPLQTLPICQNLPCLISLPLPDVKKEICHFYHPVYTDVYTTNIPQLAGAIVRHAKFGWLLVSMGQISHFFFNPRTLKIIKLPQQLVFVCISFSSPPTSPDCVVFGFHFCGNDFVNMAAYRKIKDCWSRYFLRNRPDTFAPSHCNPVFHNGVFYCLSKDGKVGIFNPNESDEENMWRVHTNLSVQDVRVTPEIDVDEVPTRSFIMECDGDIFSIFVGFIGDPVHVYKLDQSKETKKWIEVKSLGDRVMFLSHTTSLLIPAVLKGTANRIYFPRFKGNFSVFYSLNSGKYHSFGDQDPRPDWVNTSEHWNCTWFQTAIDEKPEP